MAELCKNCGRMTNVIIIERKYYYLHILKFITYPFKILFQSYILTIPFLPIKFIVLATG